MNIGHNYLFLKSYSNSVLCKHIIWAYHASNKTFFKKNKFWKEIPCFMFIFSFILFVEILTALKSCFVSVSRELKRNWKHFCFLFFAIKTFHLEYLTDNILNIKSVGYTYWKDPFVKKGWWVKVPTYIFPPSMAFYQQKHKTIINLDILGSYCSAKIPVPINKHNFTKLWLYRSVHKQHIKNMIFKKKLNGTLFFSFKLHQCIFFYFVCIYPSARAWPFI